MSTLTDFASVLSSGGITTPVFKGTMPSTPDDLIGLFDYSAGPPVHAMSGQPGRALAVQPYVQLVVRDTRPDDAEKTARDCWRLLDNRGGTINGVHYGGIFALQSPFYFRLDEAGRVCYAVNFRVVKANASSS